MTVRIGQAARRRLGLDMAALTVAVRHRRDPGVRIGLGHPQRQRTPAAAHLQDRLTVAQVGMCAGLRQRRRFGLIQGFRAGRIQAGTNISAARPGTAERTRAAVRNAAGSPHPYVRRWRAWAMSRANAASSCGPSRSSRFLASVTRLVDRRTGDEIGKGRVLKLANGDIGQVHRASLAIRRSLQASGNTPPRPWRMPPPLNTAPAMPTSGPKRRDFERSAHFAPCFFRRRCGGFWTKCTNCTLFFARGASENRDVRSHAATCPSPAPALGVVNSRYSPGDEKRESDGKDLR